MTVQEMVDELRAAMGNRTDLVTARYVQWLNWSQYELAGCHKERMFAPRRFHQLEVDYNFALRPLYTDQVSGFDTTLTYMTLDNPTLVTDGAYNDFVVNMGGEERVIVEYVASQARAYVTPAFSQVWPVGTLYSMRQRRTDIQVNIQDMQYILWTFERMELAADGTLIENVPWSTLANTDPFASGTPSQFARRGNQLLFNLAPTEEVWVKSRAKIYPTRFLTANLNATPMFPEMWHEVIVQGAVYRGFEKLMEPARAAEAQQRFVDLVINRRDDYEVEQQFQSRRAKMRLFG